MPMKVRTLTMESKFDLSTAHPSSSANNWRNSPHNLPEATAAAAGAASVLADGEAHTGSTPDLWSASSDLGESDATDFPGW